MRLIEMSADELVESLLQLSAAETVCILDSCGVGYLGSHLLIAGVRPVEIVEFSGDPEQSLQTLNELLTLPDLGAVFTISYDFGNKLHRIDSAKSGSSEPDVYLALFDCLIIHDYDRGQTSITGNKFKFQNVLDLLRSKRSGGRSAASGLSAAANFSKSEYFAAIEAIKERIRCGDTYQTNFTRQITATIPPELRPAELFRRLRTQHPSPFAAYLERRNSTVISASPERFIRIDNGMITTSPIKGTRPRGTSPSDDARFRRELLASSKDLAENTMIVDLLRNDLGQVCEFGTVVVEKLCEIEEHPTFFHLVSTVTGLLRADADIADILRAVFPCGSITGAPKISTMKIIDEIEPDPRGLSMGAIGYRVPVSFGIGESIDMSVAIRTMVVQDDKAIFNVGGGIVIDSDPENEYEETVTKSLALLTALGLAK
jgi:para-aminobenzoate synthetase component 1